MTKTFTAQIDDWVRKSRARMLAVAQTATKSVIDDAQTPVAKGGRMRVDTGFLRNSGKLSLNGLPSGPSQQIEGMPAAQNIDALLGTTALGQDIFFGWTAEYARFRESKDAFLGLAAQKWPLYVQRAVAEAKRRIR